MKRNKPFNRFMAILLCAAMVITYLPGITFSFAEDGSEPESAEAAVEKTEQAPVEKKAEPAAEKPSNDDNSGEKAEKKAPEAPAVESAPAASEQTNEPEQGSVSTNVADPAASGDKSPEMKTGPPEEAAPASDAVNVEAPKAEEGEEENTLTVTFRDSNGKELDKRKVEKGKAIGELPDTADLEQKDGYEVFWAVGTEKDGEWTASKSDIIDKDEIVKEDLDIIPYYLKQVEEQAEIEEAAPDLRNTKAVENAWTITFYNRDAEVHKTVEVEKGSAIGDQLPGTIGRDEYYAYWAVGEIVQGGQGQEISVTGPRIGSGWVPEADTTIVPDYDMITWKVKFYTDENKTEQVGDTKTVNYTSSYCLNDIPQVPVKNGYSGKWVYSGGDFGNDVTITEDTDVWAEYTQTAFTVTFMVQEKEYDKDTYYSGDSLKLPADPVVEGKDFEGWYSGTTQYKTGDPVTSNLTLVAKFKDQYYVNFVILDDEGNETERLSQYFRSIGEPIGTMPQNPFVSGKVFEKWVDKDTGEEITAATVVNDNITAVAKFRTIDIYNITAEYYYLDDNGREVIFNTDLIQAEAHEIPYTITAPATTQTSGDHVEGSPIYYVETQQKTVSESDFNNTDTALVRFQYVEYTAEYDYVYMLKDLTGDGYTEIPNSRKHVYGVLNSIVTPEVKTFDYATLESAPQAEITQATGQELPVYYTRKSFQVSYESNGGSYVSGATVPYGTDYTVSSTVPTKDGYTFAEWYKDAGLTQPADNSVTVEGDTILYAKWNGANVNYSIVYMFEKYNDAGTQSSFVYDTSETGTAATGSTVHANDSSIPDKTRTGWEKDNTRNAASSVVVAADGSSVLYVYYKLTEYTFSFRPGSYYGYANVTATLNGDTKTGNNNFTYTMTVKLGQDISTTWPTSVTNASFNYYGTYRPDFQGWTHPDGTVYVTKRLLVTSDMLPTSGTSITYTAGWILNSETYTVNYWLQNADNNQYTKSTKYSQTVTSSQGGINLGAKDIAGYTYNSSKDDHEYTGYGPGRHITTFNFYYDRDTFKIDYFYGSSNLNTIDNVKFDANINKSPYVWTPTAAQCNVDSDYTFAGWYSNSNLQGEPYVFSTMPASNLVLYAKWTAPNYTVSFVDEDGTTSLSDNQTVAKYGKVTTPSNPTKAGYVFDGWYTSADGDTLFDWNTQITRDTTVYAHWSRATLTYTVKYVRIENGEEIEVSPAKTVTNPNLVVGQEVTEKAIAVAGYRPLTLTETLALTGETESDVITFVYVEKKEFTSYIVQYILDPAEYPGDIKVAEDKTVEEVPGDTSSVIENAAAVNYTKLYTTHPELDGIEFYPDAVEKTLVISAAEENNILTFYYSSYKHATVKVHYVDMAGNEIADSDEQILKVGKTFTLSRTPIQGWELNKAAEGTSYGGTEAGSSYKITEAVTENGLEFTLFYQKKLTITVNSNSKQYDGTALTLPEALAAQVEVDGLLDGDNLSSIAYTYTGNDVAGGRLNAGTATVTPKDAILTGTHAGTANYYTIRYISGALEVTKINVTIRIEPDRWTGNVYDGTVKKTGFTNPGKGIEDYVIISHDGYKETYLNTVWDAVKSKATYDASAVGLHYVGKAESDAGDYTYFENAITLADLPEDPNYSVSLYIRPGRLQILPKAATITTGTAEKAYDGTPLTNNTAIIDGLVDGESVTLAATGTITDPGHTENTYSITWDNAKASNYNITENLGTLTVTQAKLTVTVKDKEVPYNGEEQSGRSFPATITGTGSKIETEDYVVEGLGAGDTLAIAYTPATKTNAGEYTGAFAESFTITRTDGEETVDVSEFYEEPTFTPGNLKIDPIDVTVTIVGANNTTNYDGKEHTITGYTATASSSLYNVDNDFTFSGTATAARTNVGTTNMNLAADQFTNNNTNFGTVTFNVTDGYQTISPVDEVIVTITGHYNTADYDGEEHSVSGYDVQISNPLYTEADFTFSGTAEAKRTDAGTTNMGITAEQFTNTNTNFDKVTFNVTDGYQTINPISVVVTITGHNNTTDYDGSEHSVNGYDVEISNPLYTEADFTFSGTAEAARTDAGTTEMELAASQFTNNNANFATVTFNVTDGYQTIDPIDVTVTIIGANNTTNYDGEEHIVTGYTATAGSTLYDVEKDFTFSGTAEAKRTNAGTTSMGLAADQFENTNTNFKTVTFAVTDGYQTINPIEVTVTIVGANNTTDYDGKEHSVSGYTATASTDLYDVKKDFTFNGNASATRTDAGTTNMGLAEDQFENTNGNFTNVTFVVTDGYQTINPIDVTVTITGHNNTTDYDGEEHSVSGYDVQISNPLYTEADFTFTGTAEAKRTIAGTTNMNLAAEQFTNSNANFGTVTFNVTDGYQTINPIDVTVTITGHNSTVDYDGEEHSVSGYEVEISNPLYTEADFTFSGTAEAKRTDAGTTNMGLAATQFTNNNTNFGTVTFNVTDGYQTINPIDVTVTITGHFNTTTYDSQEHTVTGYDVEISNPLYTEADFTFSGTAEAKRTDEGTTDMGLAASQFTNNNTSFGTVTFNVTDGYQTITPVDEVVVTIIGHNNTTDYDGNEHSVNGYDVEISNPLYTETDFTFSGTAEAKRTDAGTTNMGLAASQFTNNNTNFSTVIFNVTDGYQTITPINVTVTITGHNSTVDYDGEEHSVSSYDVEISNPLYTEADFTFSGTAEAKRTDAGTTNMGLAASQFTNTNTNFGTVTFSVTDGYQTINPISVTVTIIGQNATVDYDGNEHAITGYTATASTDLYDVEGLVKDFTFSGIATAARTDAGTTNMGLAADQFTNTNSNFENVTFNVTDGYMTINPIDVTVTIVGANNTTKYNGKEHTVTGYTATASSNLYDVTGAEKDFTFSGTDSATRTDAGTTNMGLAAEQFTNANTNFGTVTFNVTDGYQTIEKRSVTLTSATDSKVYDGNALTNSTVTVGGDGFVTGEGATYDVTGSQTLVGNSSNTFTYTLNEGTKVDNYTITKTEGTLTVTDGTNPGEDPVPDDKVVTKTDGEANDNTKYHVGDTVEWSVWVKNIYDEEKTLTVTEAEEMTIVGTVPATLAAGEDVTIKVQHVVTAADVAAGSIKNEVTAKLGDLEKHGDDTVDTEKLAITITAASGSKAYDGTALTAPTYTQTAGTLATGDKIDSVTVAGSQTAVGTSANVPSNAKIVNAAGEDVTAAYTITYVNGTLTVTAAPTPTPTPTPGGGGGGPAGGGPAVGPADDGTVIPDEPVPEVEPEVDIVDPEPPLAGGVWALVNLISAILTALGAAVALFRKKEEEDEDEENMDKAEDENEDEEDNRAKKMLAAKIAGALAGVAAPITFFLTEDMSLPMAMIDKWTVLMLVMLAVQIVAAVFNKKASELDDEEGTAEEAAN